MLFIQEISNWFHSQSLLEVIGVITGLLCVLLAALNIIWNWPLAIISVCIYIIIFFEAKLYADMGLQVYFLAMNIYGWYYWSRDRGIGDKKPVVRISSTEIILSAIGVVIFTGILGFILHKETDASFPFIDSFCTACSLIAQLFLARKVLENWLIWVFVDVIYTVVYLLKGLHLTAGMYAVYIVIALLGYIDWKKTLIVK
ncbi:nicotinamide riboside transporter PnuC [Pedobacter sp. HMF7647]|uniref:Nicotinamide riboside transporter PnuC n=1 Tax=Hufsiella arboris TaxID=2695275 RepID=A0A7K1YC11_9SPHI|nr:nicotinamide riboside transporter PnuC [Hufsiella arboris]MXV51578.1 nicotinamide riboside transporter PnuC [Hufsiella arboris]